MPCPYNRNNRNNRNQNRKQKPTPNPNHQQNHRKPSDNNGFKIRVEIPCHRLSVRINQQSPGIVTGWGLPSPGNPGSTNTSSVMAPLLIELPDTYKIIPQIGRKIPFTLIIVKKTKICDRHIMLGTQCIASPLILTGCQSIKTRIYLTSVMVRVLRFSPACRRYMYVPEARFSALKVTS